MKKQDHNRQWIWAGYPLALLPLSSSFILDNLNLSASVAEKVFVILPVLFGIPGLVVGTVNWLNGNRWNSVAQIALSILCTLWALVIAGFAFAVNHRNGL